MQTSARNQLFGTVKSVTTGAVNSEIVLSLRGGSDLVASVTNKSVETLGIFTGKEVIALVTASLVILVKDAGGYRLSARNQLRGTIERVLQGSVNCDVQVRVGGDTISSIITHESAEALQLKVNDTVTVAFKAGSVILGVAN